MAIVRRVIEGSYTATGIPACLCRFLGQGQQNQPRWRRFGHKARVAVGPTWETVSVLCRRSLVPGMLYGM